MLFYFISGRDLGHIFSVFENPKPQVEVARRRDAVEML